MKFIAKGMSTRQKSVGMRKQTTEALTMKKPCSVLWNWAVLTFDVLTDCEFQGQGKLSSQNVS